MNNPHDKIFRKLLENKQEALQIINSNLEKTELATEDIENYNSSFITSELKNSEADIVYKLKGRDIFFLLEHQTYIDYSMPYRILKYETEIMECCLRNRKESWQKHKNNKQYKYPLIIPIIIYTGHEEWKPYLSISEIQEHYDKYEGIEFSKYNVYDINKIDDEEFLRQESAINRTFLLEKAKNKKEFELKLNKISKQKMNLQEKAFLKTTIEAIFKKWVTNEEIQRVFNKFEIGDDKNMLAVIDMLDREIEKEKKEGIEQGIKISQIKYIKNMLKEKMSISLIHKVTGVDVKRIKEIKENKI